MAPETPSSLVPSGRAITAAVVLNDMAERLAACKSYRDTGSCRVEIDGEVVSQTTFRTAFERPGKFVFQFGGSQRDGRDGHGFIWTVDPDVLARGGPDWCNTNKSGSLAVAINQNGGDAALDVPGLLLPGDVPTSRLALLRAAELTGEENIGGSACYVIHSAGFIPGSDIRLWIDKASHLLLRVIDTSDGSKFGCRQVWTRQYSPEMNVVIPVADLALPASGLSDG